MKITLGSYEILFQDGGLQVNKEGQCLYFNHRPVYVSVKTYGAINEFRDSAYDSLIPVTDGVLGECRFVTDNGSVLYVRDLYTARDGSLKTSLRSPRLALGKTYLRKAKLEADNLHGCINGSLTGSEFALGSLHFQNSAFLLFADDNHLGLGATYDNEKDKTDKGEFYATARFSRDEQDSLAIQAHILPSNVYFDGTGWNISPAVLDYRNNSLTLTEPISATSMNQSISIAGGISPHRRDTLSLKMDHFDIGFLGSLMEPDFDLRGQATGRALVTSPTQSGMALLMNLRCDSTYIASHPAGNVELSSVWDDESNLFRILCRNELDGRRNIDLRAGFSPKNKSLKADLNLDRFEAGYAAPLLEGVLSTLDGKLSGHIHAAGTLDQLNLSSEDLRIDESRLALDFTGVPYHVSGPLHLTSQGVFFDTLTLRDEHQGSGTLDGAFAFSGPDGMAADLHIQLENMEALRTTEKDNSSFYGNVSANGRVSLTGPVNALLLDINASSVSFSVDGNAIRFVFPSGGINAHGDVLRAAFQVRGAQPVIQAGFHPGIVFRRNNFAEERQMIQGIVTV